MAVIKHKLTKGTDTIGGNGATDLFLAPLIGGKQSLTDADVLNGKGGFDTINAMLTGTSLTPQLANIEKGVFGWKESASFELDLAKADAMTALVLNGIDSDFDISSAAALQSLSLNKSHVFMHVNGVDASKTQHLDFSFSDTSNTSVQVATLGGAALKSVDVTLDNSTVNLSVDASVTALAIHGKPSFSSQLTLTHLSAVDHIRTITIDGAAPLNLMRSAGFAELRTVDARAATGQIGMNLDSAALVRFLGGHSDDGVRLVTLGGTTQKPATVELNAGFDLVNAIGFALDGAVLHISGGAGTDTLIASGTVANSGGMLDGMEKLLVQNASGSWHLAGSGVERFSFFNAAASTTVIGQIQSGATVTFQAANASPATPVAGAGGPHAAALEKQAASVDILVAGATQSKTESLTIELYDGVQIGDFTHGVSAAGLSDLTIDSQGSDNMILIGSIGGAHDGATLTVAGSSGVMVAAIDSANAFIDTVKITNAAGANIVGLSWGLQAFDPDGATIIGGAGDDVLVGGAGNDVIRTGGGDNEVYGSDSSDLVFLKANSGLDVLYYGNTDFSPATGGMDTIHNFAVTDTIDIASLVSSIIFKGNVNSMGAGLATLSTVSSCAFFSTLEHVVYIDVNHDGVIDSTHDLGVMLADVDAIASWNLVA